MVWEQFPTALLLLEPALLGLRGLFCSKMYGVVHFQQVTKSSSHIDLLNQGANEPSSIRSALSLSLLASSPFFIFLPSPVSDVRLLILFSLGYGLAVLLVIAWVVPILHYVRSPSICQYIEQRFHTQYRIPTSIRDMVVVRWMIAALHCVLLGCEAVVLLVLAGLLVSQMLPMSALISTSLIGYFGYFAVVFGGQAAMSLSTFFAGLVSCPLQNHERDLG
jgi:hypothetical protein